MAADDATSKKVFKNKSVHQSLKWVLLLSQCFGQMPVVGITEPSSHFLEFRWLSWRTLYALLTATGAAFLSAIYLARILNGGAILFEYSAFVFHLNTLTISLFFLKLAVEWPELMHKWAEVEASLRSYGWPKHLQTRITVLTVIVLIIAAMEYGLTKVNSLLVSIKYKRDDDDLFEYYVTINLYREIFEKISYSLWRGILLQIINILLTFAWSFNDVFIMIISSVIALHFKQLALYMRVLGQNPKAADVNTWRKIRENYNKLSGFTKRMDEALSYIILTSFGSNLFSILMQLFRSISMTKNPLEKAYFFLSFGFLIMRTVCVTLYGGWIYDESREPLTILHSLPTEDYNVEVKRLVKQISFDTVALSGKRFFFITRGLVLSIAGAVVTYELVLIQFNQNLLANND